MLMMIIMSKDEASATNGDQILHWLGFDAWTGQASFEFSVQTILKYIFIFPVHFLYFLHILFTFFAKSELDAWTLDRSGHLIQQLDIFSHFSRIFHFFCS